MASPSNEDIIKDPAHVQTSRTRSHFKEKMDVNLDPVKPERTEDIVKPADDGSVLRGWRLYTVQFGLCIALLLGAMDSSIVATALVTIGHDFNDFERLQWVVESFLLTYAGFALIFSRISDIVGRKWASIGAMAILVAGSLGAGLSQSLNQVIAFRALQGLGGAGVYAIPLTVLPEITPVEIFPIMSGVSGILLTSAAVLGPTLGGIITTQSTWRWVFLFNVPSGGFVIALLIFAWPRQKIIGRISWKRLDWVGCLLTVVISVALIFALQEAGAKAYAWSSPVIIALLVIVAVAAIALFFWIWYLSSGTRLFEPLFPAHLLTDRVLGTAIAYTAVSGFVLFTAVVEIPQRCQIVNSKNAQEGGIALLPLLGASAFSSGVGGYISSKRNFTCFTCIFAGAMMLLGSALLSTVRQDTTVPRSLYGFEVLLGFGLGSSLVAALLVVKLNAREEDSASAQGLLSETRILGGNIGLAISTIILNARLSTDLTDSLTPAEIGSVQASLNNIATLAPPQQLAVRHAFARAFQSQCWACAGVGGVAFITGCFLWQRVPPTFAGNEKKKKELKAMDDARQPSRASEAALNYLGADRHSGTPTLDDVDLGPGDADSLEAAFKAAFPTTAQREIAVV